MSSALYNLCSDTTLLSRSENPNIWSVSRGGGLFSCGYFYPSFFFKQGLGMQIRLTLTSRSSRVLRIVFTAMCAMGAFL